MKKYISAIAAIAISTQLVAVEKQNIPMASTQPNQKTTIVSAKSIDLEQEVVKNEESNIASSQGNKLPLPKLIQKTKVKSYDAVIEMLKTRDSYKVQKNQDDTKAAEEEQKKEARITELKAEKKQKDIDSKIDREVQELLLPIPLGSVTIGEKIIVYAEYREKRLRNDALPNKLTTLVTEKTTTENRALTNIANNDIDTPAKADKSTFSSKTAVELQDAIFESKRIRVKVGDVFKGGWVVKTLNENFIEYSNPRFPNETVKKYN